ncbi:hypothetical protein BDV38DRAFT_266205 [Aspergillus pseudotamarii]|uniref:Uncharacterized protein n=1 Tax=Aspergillus pseudotamarii TaxID=132259 RepID=A0A5N6SAW4_ASPPS|nr:uncharacterized protein BDV38DRAFT_266205 [Aspergillus pseudotamarii]KAE8130801.1 hypothetical protein BDV38DRAFT_266205 [Aspergillus pseudotamarii]
MRLPPRRSILVIDVFRLRSFSDNPSFLVGHLLGRILCLLVCLDRHIMDILTGCDTSEIINNAALGAMVLLFLGIFVRWSLGSRIERIRRRGCPKLIVTTIKILIHLFRAAQPIILV